MTWISLIGFLGAIISGSAYVPQIHHLIAQRCTAGLSRRAFGMWLVASIFVFVNALYIGSSVFIFLTGIQTVASAVIFGFTVLYNGKVCPTHIAEALAAQTKQAQKTD